MFVSVIWPRHILMLFALVVLFCMYSTCLIACGRARAIVLPSRVCFHHTRPLMLSFLQGPIKAFFEGGRRFWFLFVLKDAAKLNQLLDVVCSEDKGFCVSKANKTSRSSNALSVWFSCALQNLGCIQLLLYHSGHTYSGSLKSQDVGSVLSLPFVTSGCRAHRHI